MDTQIGLIGFFDILGYQNLLEKNEPEDIAQSVLPFLTGISTTIQSEMKTYFKEEHQADEIDHPIYNVIESLRWLIFSDTILLTLPFDSSDKFPEKYWLIFFHACVNLQNNMFDAGLPVRGVINYGKFYIKDTCFAGRTIIEAYKLCQQLEIAACVFTDTAHNEFLKQKESVRENFSFLYDAYVYKYLVQTKNGESRLPLLVAHVYDPEEDDIRKQVLSSFWGHNKDIPISVQNKITNTEQWLRYLKMRRD